MGKIDNLKNKKFNDLKAIKFMKLNKYNKAIWLCKCNCGNYVKVLSNHIKNGNTKSCGCLQLKIIKKLKTIHGMRKTKFYNCWRHIKARCNNKNNKSYKDYGNRGITYDPKWENFLGFYEDMYFKYRYAQITKGIKNPSIERENVNGNYCEENCIFIELKDQPKNTRKTRLFIAKSPFGKIFISKNQNEFGRNHNLSSSEICLCLQEKINKVKNWKFKYIK